MTSILLGNDKSEQLPAGQLRERDDQHPTTNVYDAKGRVTSQTDALGRVTTAAQLTGETSANLGPDRAFDYDPAGRLNAETGAAYTYDRADQLTGDAGAGGGEAIIGGVDASWGSDSCGRPVYVGEISGGVGAEGFPFPAEVHGGASYTWSVSFSIPKAWHRLTHWG